MTITITETIVEVTPTPAVVRVVPMVQTVAVVAQGGPGSPGPPGTTDHHLLTDLDLDDHPQYLNNARGDARYSLLAAANTFLGSLLQTILGNLRVGKSGATDARLRVDDNNSAGPYVAELHADNDDPWTLGLFNDDYSASAGFEGYIRNDGVVYLGTSPANDIWLFTNGVERLRVGGDGVIELRGPISSNAAATFAGNLAALNLALGGALTTSKALTITDSADRTIDLTGPSDLQALAWDAAQSKYRPRTISGGGGGIGMTVTTADNTGATDATAQLQADLATAVAAGHKRLYLPAGTYKISLTSGILFSSGTDGLEIFGDGPGKAVLQLAPSTTLTADTSFFRLTGKFQWVHDLTINGGSGTAGAFDFHGVEVYAAAFHSHVSNVECYNIYGNGTSGGSGISTYQPFNQNEISTTLGATIGSGAQTVTPPSMLGIYAGRTLVIGGTTETIQVTSTTATTFTATFANAHNSADSVSGTSNGHQYALIEDCLVHDSFKATAYLINSSENVLRRDRAINVGATTTQHGFYVQGGANRIEYCYAEGIFGYSYHLYNQVPNLDGSGNVVFKSTSLNPKTYHGIASAGTAGSGNYDVPNGESLNRYTVFDSCLFRRTKNGPACNGLGLGDDAIVSNCVFEDAIGLSGGIVIGGSVNKRLVATSNIIRILNGTVPSNSLGVVCYGGVLSNNAIIGWNGGSGAMRLESGGRANGNYIKHSSATGIIINGDDVTIENNVIENSGSNAGISCNQTNPARVRVHDNKINCTGSARGLDFFAATTIFTGSIYNNFWNGTNSRIYDIPTGLNIYNNDGGWGFRGNGTYQQLTAAAGRLLSFPKGTNTLTSGLLVKIASGILATVGTGDTVFVGVASSTTDATGANTLITGQVGAEAAIACDGAWTIGNVGIISTTSAGKIHDTAAATPPASPASYVLFLDSGGAAGNARCLLMRTM